ncbi:RNA polymerase sigma factor [Candidatus Peregrinibacteria bacterium]|jgi:RNA polymerase sigma-70 factor, ECF subfamily|nr:RNA polymerase sigma factor [Candidatus Peregrinibacteria bacterium]MBT3599169.1 RNA polymerase sigma factor [Candidatus Peregrinibacteria bacterium]MBT4366830.1 RNA polymerase sigma factor [Candidatus Peregrinibacteria bacterium]MBT6730676.1 RNA polymerase sigma factor [Candidatus Peregrinibacteria bacterium]MBT7009145.1 RNA polymerase sigma factor [Candidatus Peregrinibacteria bacterium]
MNHLVLADLSDEELASLVSSQNEAYDILMERYEIKLMRYIRRLSVLNQQEVEDILQDVFLKAYMYINDFDKSLKFSSWIYRITHNAVISEHRKWAKYAYEPIDQDAENIIQLIDDIDFGYDFDRKILRDIMQKGIASIPLKEREAIQLYYMEGFCMQEISDILKKPIGSIATLIRRGKQRLKKFIDRNFPSKS